MAHFLKIPTIIFLNVKNLFIKFKTVLILVSFQGHSILVFKVKNDCFLGHVTEFIPRAYYIAR